MNEKKNMLNVMMFISAINVVDVVIKLQMMKKKEFMTSNPMMIILIIIINEAFVMMIIMKMEMIFILCG